MFTFCTDQADLRAIDFAVDPLCFVLGYVLLLKKKKIGRPTRALG
ncbi:MAG TPA: hypothetical protein VN744_02530 [Casimicrobiaceae bacterium]|nr:hypothetical protein [Casimicrobiaceae bacterium]